LFSWGLILVQFYHQAQSLCCKTDILNLPAEDVATMNVDPKKANALLLQQQVTGQLFYFARRQSPADQIYELYRHRAETWWAKKSGDNRE